MKKNIFFAIFAALFFLIYFTQNVKAQSPTATATDTAVEQIKDKIASKVAEIASDTPIVFRGKVKSINNDAKTFELSNGEKTYTALYLKDTNYFWLRNDNKGKLSLTFANVEEDDDLVAVGNLVKATSQINAKYIYGKFFPKVVVGKITTVGKTTLDVKTISSNTSYTVDISNIKETLKIGKDEKQTEIQSTDLKANYLVLARGTLKAKTTDTIVADRILLIQN